MINQLQLDSVIMVPRVVSHGMFLSSCDDKSGYDHVLVTEESQTYLGVQWAGYYFVYRTIPFGFKASAYIYHTIGMIATSYCRSLNIPVLQYIDDRLIGEWQSQAALHLSARSRAERVVYMVCQVLLRLGYFLSVTKSSLIPQTSLTFLGFIVDTVHECFRLPQEKKIKFATLREDILTKRKVSIKTLQRFVGKCVSFVLVIPGAKFYIRQCNAAISQSIISGTDIFVEGELRDEISYWKFLDSWEGILPWGNEKHLQVVLTTDASLYKWGAVVYDRSEEGQSISMADYWNEGDERAIHLKEAQALCLALRAIEHKIANARVDAYVDNMAVVEAWNNQGCRALDLNAILQDIFVTVLQYNCSLVLKYVPSGCNEADIHSRTISICDAMLSKVVWADVDSRFGPHTLDLMALDSNAQRGRDGQALPHFSPTPMPFSQGVNVFSQSWSNKDNPYVFPPFGLVGSVLRHVVSMGVDCTFVAPSLSPIPVWWPLLQRYAKDSFLLGDKTDRGILFFPTKKGYKKDTRGLVWPLVAYRLEF